MTRAKNGAPLAWLKEHVNHEGEACLPWPFSFGSNKYGNCRDEDGKNGSAHRIMCRLAHGEPPSPKHEAAHSCGKGKSDGCIHPGHLRWATKRENEDDKILHGQVPRGDRHGCVKLTESQAIKIKALKGVIPQRQIAANFKISQPTVAAIHVGRIWAHLP